MMLEPCIVPAVLGALPLGGGSLAALSGEGSPTPEWVSTAIVGGAVAIGLMAAVLLVVGWWRARRPSTTGDERSGSVRLVDAGADDPIVAALGLEDEAEPGSSRPRQSGRR